MSSDSRCATSTTFEASADSEMIAVTHTSTNLPKASWKHYVSLHAWHLVCMEATVKRSSAFTAMSVQRLKAAMEKTVFLATLAAFRLSFTRSTGLLPRCRSPLWFGDGFFGYSNRSEAFEYGLHSGRCHTFLRRAQDQAYEYPFISERGVVF